MGENPETYEMIVPNNDFNELLSSVDASVKKEKLQEIAARNGTLEDIKNMQTYRYQNKDILTAVSDEDAKIIDQFLLENNIVYNGDVYNLIDQCKNALANQTTYTLKPGDLPSGVNYLDYFLNVHKQGYCVHYASALALMLRRNGIAARFVLGYQADGSRGAVSWMADGSGICDYRYPPGRRIWDLSAGIRKEGAQGTVCIRAVSVCGHDTGPALREPDD